MDLACYPRTTQSCSSIMACLHGMCSDDHIGLALSYMVDQLDHEHHTLLGDRLTSYNPVVAGRVITGRNVFLQVYQDKACGSCNQPSPPTDGLHSHSHKKTAQHWHPADSRSAPLHASGLRLPVGRRAAPGPRLLAREMSMDRITGFDSRDRDGANRAPTNGARVVSRQVSGHHRFVRRCE